MKKLQNTEKKNAKGGFFFMIAAADVAWVGAGCLAGYLIGRYVRR